VRFLGVELALKVFAGLYARGGFVSHSVKGGELCIRVGQPVATESAGAKKSLVAARDHPISDGAGANTEFDFVHVEADDSANVENLLRNGGIGYQYGAIEVQLVTLA
jgi:hypothetical protein